MMSNLINQNQFQNFQANPDFELIEEEDDDQQNQNNNMQQQEQFYYNQNQNQDQEYQNQEDYQAQQLMGGQYNSNQQEFGEYVNCPQHPQNKVTTICRNPKCNEPLCSQCVVQHKLYHQELHTQPDIQSIIQVRAESLEKLDSLLNLYQKKGNLRKNEDAGANGQNSLFILNEAKKHVYQMVETYFKELERGIEGSRGLQDQSEFEHYSNLKGELEGEYYMQALLEILENYEEFQQKSSSMMYQNQNNFEDSYSGKYIGVNEAKIFSMRKELGDYVFLKEKNEKIQTNDVQKLKEKKKIFSDLQNLADQSLNQTQIQESLQKTTHLNQQNQQQNNGSLVQSMPQNKVHSRQPIFGNNKEQTEEKDQYNSIKSSKHHRIQPITSNNNSNQKDINQQQQDILPVSNQKNQQIFQHDDQPIKRDQEALQIIPNHQARLQKLSTLDERMAKLQSKITRKQFSNDSQYLGNNSSVFNNNSQLIEDQNQEILAKISNKYQIPLSQAQNKNFQHIDVEVTGPEAFSMNQVLVYFQENSKKMYTVDCSKSNIALNDITVKTEDPLFKIPQYHRSINTPNDGIYLIGGIHNNSSHTASDQVYKIELDETDLVPIQRMNYNRASPGVCFANKCIYVCSGFEKHDESSTIDTFEKLDLKTNKWNSLKRCNFKASSCALATFEDKYIFKFGGKSDLFNVVDKIEYYDIDNDEWNVVHVPEKISRNVQIASDLGAIQINDQNILFYGGAIHLAKCNKAYVLQIQYDSDGKIDNNNFIIQPVNNMNIGAPISGLPLLRDGEVISFIDVVNMEDINVSCYNRKTVCMFNGTSWKTL